MNLEDEFKGVQERITKEMDRLQSLADAQVQPPKKILNYTNHTEVKYRWSAFYDRGWSSFDKMCEYFFWSNSYYSKAITEESLQKALTQFDNTLAHWKSDNHETFLANREVIAHNQLQYERVQTIMETLGVKTSFTTWGYKTQRSRKMIKSTTMAQWPKEVADAVPCNCGYDTILRKIQTKRDQVEAYGKKWIKENAERLRKEAEEKASKEKETKKLKTLAMLCTKYDLDIDSEEYDIECTITSQCKYLYLAHYLQLNRGDWNDGCSYAETGLAGFDIVTGLDQEIYDDINSYCEDWDGDGRCFRDCKWNYSELFGMVDEKLLKDYELTQEYIDRY